jgi:hypothetical protein
MLVLNSLFAANQVGLSFAKQYDVLDVLRAEV